MYQLLVHLRRSESSAGHGGHSASAEIFLRYQKIGIRAVSEK